MSPFSQNFMFAITTLFAMAAVLQGLIQIRTFYRRIWQLFALPGGTSRSARVQELKTDGPSESRQVSRSAAHQFRPRAKRWEEAFEPSLSGANFSRLAMVNEIESIDGQSWAWILILVVQSRCAERGSPSWRCYSCKRHPDLLRKSVVRVLKRFQISLDEWRIFWKICQYFSSDFLENFVRDLM